MKQAPSVFVPTRPEGDGIALPVLLSVLAHGLLIGFIVLTHQTPKLDTPASIETTMVSPEQLAEMQEQILANRSASMSEQGASYDGDPELSPSAIQDMPANDQNTVFNDSNTASRPPIFKRSNGPADPPVDRNLLISRAHKLKIQQANEEYERKMAELAEQIDQAIESENDAIINEALERERIRQTRLDELKKIEESGPMIKRPSKPSTNKNNPSDPINMDLSDGAPIASGSATGKPSSGASSTKSSSRSVGEYTAAIGKKIQRSLQAPMGTQGIKATLRLRLDASGNVLSATASGSNSEVNKAAEQAALSASPLPIDINNPEAYTNLRINVIVE